MKQRRPEDDPLRGTGRTTALMLKTIAGALQAPDEWIQFEDHADRPYNEIPIALRDALKDLCHRIGLTMAIRLRGTRILILSPIKMLRKEEERRKHRAERALQLGLDRMARHPQWTYPNPSLSTPPRNRLEWQDLLARIFAIVGAIWTLIFVACVIAKAFE